MTTTFSKYDWTPTTAGRLPWSTTPQTIPPFTALPQWNVPPEQWGIAQEIHSNAGSADKGAEFLVGPGTGHKGW